MIRRTITTLLVALVASFALSSPASAATKKPARPRVKHSSHAAATTTKPAVKKMKRTVRKKTTAKSSTTARKSGTAQKRKPTTKPH
jgi:TRAP-type C4-dicarboxylate transport system substrate-binding protein